jgi:hypothetical protein
MTLSKRERVIRFLELDDEPDKCPIFTLGFETSGWGMQQYYNSEEYKNVLVKPEELDFGPESFRTRIAWLITQMKFWHADLVMSDPFKKYKRNIYPMPEGYPNAENLNWNCISGRIMSVGKNPITGRVHEWYVDGFFKTKEKLHEVWDEYGKPIDRITEGELSPKLWKEYVDGLSPHVYPMANLSLAMSEYLCEGHTHGYAMKLMRKDPKHMHYVMNEYTKANVETVKRLGDAGVDIVMFLDDLGYRGRGIWSPKNFKEFVLPYYKRIYQAARKKGMFMVQHSCGYLHDYLPLMADAGLNCIQSVQPTAENDLAHLVDTLGDKLSFMGCLDDTRVLKFGTPKDVEEDVKKFIKIAGPTGNFAPGPTNTVLDPPWENVLSLISALEKYRSYPLQV